MRIRRAHLAALCLAACGLLGDECDVGRSNAQRESQAREDAANETGGVSVSPDSCLLLTSPLPAGLSVVPGTPDRMLVANSPPSSVVPVDISTQPPTVASPPVTTIPIAGVSLEGVVALAPSVAPNLALAADSGNEQVLFVDAATGALVNGMVGGIAQSSLSTAVDVTFPAGAVDSAEVAVPAPPSTTSAIAGVAVSQGLLFVTTGNTVSGAGGPNPLHLPGTVLVYDFDVPVDTPVNSGDPPQVIFTTGYNPTNVTAYSRGARHFMLVTTTGPVGLDLGVGRIDFATSSTTATRPGYVEVIEIFPAPAPPALVALIPLGERAPGFGKLAIDPSGRVGVIGSLVGSTDPAADPKERRVLAVDLETLDGLPAAAPASPVVLDGTNGNPDAVIDDPSLEITPIAGGPPASTCSGTVTAAAWPFAGRLLAADLCDGTVTSWTVDVTLTPPAFSMLKETAVVAPFAPFSTDIQVPVAMAIRDGSGSGGADVFLLLGLPEGYLCGISSGAL